MKTRNLSVGYSFPVLSDITLEVQRGEILGILGPNGSGKSTLLKTLMGALKPIDGAAYIDSLDVFSLKPGELAKKMSVMLTERSDAGFLTGFEIAGLGRYPYVDAFGRLREEDERVVMECLRMVNAEHLASKLFSEMSDGEKQKILIARALAQEPEVILMDEPTSFLDARHKIEIMLLLRRIANEKNVAIILTTHDIELALRICDRVVLVKEGRIVADGIPEEVLTPDVLSEVYEVENARFESELGSFEVRGGSAEAKVHVVCGGGTGANIMRFLAKKGVPFTAGVVHKNDVDYVVARSTSCGVVGEAAYRSISDESLKAALRLIEGKAVIDSGFPIGEINRRNLEILRLAEEVISFRSREELQKLGIRSTSVRSLSEILEVVF
ncbi:MAG: ABC transporter ATP-binding protein [Archaeoglobi archaeon]|nr:ABC transporter ATP-binding protein [Archaeoglobi archaeon]